MNPRDPLRGHCCDQVRSTLHVGVFGGAFDPPHPAHLALATAATQQLGLDVLHIVPTGDAWHRRLAPSAAGHRLRMAQLAFENEAPTNARWVVDSREALRGGPSYTIDTLVELHREYSASTRSDHSEHRATQSAPTVPGFKLFLVLGRDQYNRLEHWHRSADLRRYAIICVAERGRGCWTNAENHHLSQSINTPDVHIDLPAMSTSATAIREAVQRASPIDGLVKSSVARYIASNNLYAPLNRAPL